MRWLQLRRRWRDPDIDRFAERYAMTSTRDLVILILWELRRGQRDNAALNRVSDRLDASSDKIEESVLTNTLPNQTPNQRGD